MLRRVISLRPLAMRHLPTVRLARPAGSSPNFKDHDFEGEAHPGPNFTDHDLGAYERLKTSDDPTVILAGEIASRREWEAWANYEKQMSWNQFFVSKKIHWSLSVRHSFVHGSIRRALTIMAVYAAGAEFLHDFFHHHHTIHYILGLVGTNHAVGFIALSHLSEHFKEYLEDQDKPQFHMEERQRLDVLRIFAGQKKAKWPRHIQYYHDMWDRSRGDLGCFIEANAQEELRRAEAKGGGGGHH